MRRGKGRGQAWSMDLVIGVIIFMLAIAVIYSMLTTQTQQDTAPLRIESEVIATKLSSDAVLGVTSNRELNPDKLGNLTGISYEELKREFGINSEFCIFLQDEAGNLIYIIDANGKKYTGIGANDGQLNLSGVPCGKQIP